MKNIVAICYCFCAFVASLGAQTNTLFDENTVGKIEIYVRPDSLEYMITNLLNDEYIRCNFIFHFGNTIDTVENIGLRLRGNTSLNAQKKSFKVSFNEFDELGEYQGVRKLNLRGSHNDPTMMREKLFYHIWENAGRPQRRAAFVELYINDEYKGLYTNIEEIDKRWLKRVFGNNDGNLYKCQYPANLANLGSNPNTYKQVLTGNNERAYDLKTNEALDDYSRFVTLVTTLDQPVNADYPAKISQILNVESVIKAFALDVATGNWDDYFYNQNNYYLYDNPATGKFEFITLDTDNTIGVDWVNRDWATRNCLDWQSHSGPRPLATKLMAVPEYKEMFIQFLFHVTKNVASLNQLNNYIDQMNDLITPAATYDTYRTLDYGYTIQDFHNGIIETIDNHTPYGIKPFLELRRNKTLEQLAGLVNDNDLDKMALNLQIWPNPVTDWLYLEFTQAANMDINIFSTTGTLQRSMHFEDKNTIAVPMEDLPQGCYWVEITTERGRVVKLVIK
jgi:spore coat protein CotH